MSSIRNNLGLYEGRRVGDRRASNIANLLLDVRESYKLELTEAKLFEWHKMLFSSQDSRITTGKWRDQKEPMQVISDRHGKIDGYYLVK